MKQEKLSTIKEQVPNIVNYPDEIKYVENFFADNELDSDQTSVIFWNHLITLFERVDGNEQNDLDLSDADELSDEAQQLSNEFETYIASFRKFNLTAFENYLMQIHFEQILKGE